MRHLYLLLGWLFFVLGIIGAFLPVLPTTPFMLLALWAFSKGSEHLHRWLYDHPLFGPPLQRWQRWGVIPARAKMAAIGAMLVSALVVVWMPYLPLWLKVGVIIILIIVALYIWSRPDRAPDT
ncbi:YbaN family protein [Magnetococcus sp. PR-3]|uniref:YbaN family protein n=1 Tax=Magnetococcus sp. PR-3 TaxID=3120355 RepID=UPI003FA5C18F